MRLGLGLGLLSGLIIGYMFVTEEGGSPGLYISVAPTTATHRDNGGRVEVAVAGGVEAEREEGEVGVEGKAGEEGEVEVAMGMLVVVEVMVECVVDGGRGRA